MTDATAQGTARPHLAHAHGAAGTAHAHTDHQQHPLKVYFLIWVLLFVLSAFSYLVDYVGFQGYLRWSLVLLFMMLKAGLIMAIFMHMRWERLALTLAIVLPPLALLVFVGIMAYESDYTFLARSEYFGATD